MRYSRALQAKLITVNDILLITDIPPEVDRTRFCANNRVKNWLDYVIQFASNVLLKATAHCKRLFQSNENFGLVVKKYADFSKNCKMSVKIPILLLMIIATRWPLGSPSNSQPYWRERL